MKVQYAINLRDKRIVLCTQETLNNIDYYPISKDVADAINKKIVDKDEVVQKIRAKMYDSPEAWDDFIKSKKSQNVHQATVTRDNIEQKQTIINPESVKDELKLDAVSAKPETEVPDEKPETDENHVPRRGRPAKDKE